MPGDDGPFAPMSGATPSLFATGATRAVALGPGDAPALQDFFVRNPAYFLAVNGAPPAPHEARDEIEDDPPPGWPFTRRWAIGFVDDSGALVGMANVCADLPAATVWHVGWFMIATASFGSALAGDLYRGLEAWAADGGAQWMRLGVVEGNARAERFWLRRGFADVRLRRGVAMGRPVNTVRVMLKPLAGGTIGNYLAQVPSDWPDPER